MKTDVKFYKHLLDNLYDGVYFVDKDRRITYWNKGAERITGYSAAEATGKHCSDNLLMHSDKQGNVLCLSLCPLAYSISDGKERSKEVYLRHKDGHRVPVTVRVAPMTDEQGVIMGGVEIFTDNTPAALAFDRLAELERMAYLDPLTGLANRRYAEITINARLEELQRYGWRFGVIFIDIDLFKNVNDRYGHEAGDEVLKTVAKTLQNSVRSFDVVSRWGGEEYVAVIANIEAEELFVTANRCRALVEQSSLPSKPLLKVTISVGATLALADDTVSTLVKRADELMYQSKKAGRNCVTVDGPCVTDIRK
jgi:diguanylate cyclase (GGDEF)-like protein/PAS domain S-box-containing protein